VAGANSCCPTARPDNSTVDSMPGLWRSHRDAAASDLSTARPPHRHGDGANELTEPAPDIATADGANHALHRRPHRRLTIDQFGQVIDVLVSTKRDRTATRRFFTRALEHGSRPSEVSTDRAPAYPRVLDELLPSVCHVLEQYANNPIEADHGRLKSRLRPMRGLKRLRSARVISAGHAFVQNLRRGHYELSMELDPQHRLPAAFAELALAI
jgi:IS6 family transposase